MRSAYKRPAAAKIPPAMTPMTGRAVGAAPPVAEADEAAELAALAALEAAEEAAELALL